MRSRSNIVRITTAAFVLSTFVSCSPAPPTKNQAAPAEDGADENKKKRRTTTTTRDTFTDDCEGRSSRLAAASYSRSPSASGNELEAREGSPHSALALVNTVNYNDDIKPLITSACIQCHANASSNGALDTFSAVSALASESLDRINRTGAGKMPPSTQLSLADRRKFQDWVDGNKPETRPASGSSGSGSGSRTEDDEEEDDGDCEDGIGGGDGDGSGSGSGSGSGTEKDWAEVLNPPKLKECHDQGKVFDRRGSGSCHVARRETTCTKDSAIALLGNGPAARDRVNQTLGSDGFELDQCGKDGTRGFVFFYKKSSDAESTMLQIRVLSQ